MNIIDAIFVIDVTATVAIETVMRRSSGCTTGCNWCVGTYARSERVYLLEESREQAVKLERIEAHVGRQARVETLASSWHQRKPVIHAARRSPMPLPRGRVRRWRSLKEKRKGWRIS